MSSLLRLLKGDSNTADAVGGSRHASPQHQHDGDDDGAPHIDWDLVRQRIHSHTEEIAEKDEEGQTCLYKVCCILSILPLDILELMLVKDRDFRFRCITNGASAASTPPTTTLTACNECGCSNNNGPTTDIPLPIFRCAMELRQQRSLPTTRRGRRSVIVPSITKIVEAMELFMKHAPQCLKYVNCNGETILHFVLASMNCRRNSLHVHNVGHMELVVHFICKLLVEADPDLVLISRDARYGKPCQKRTPFHFALRDPRYSTVSLHELLTPPRRRVGGGNWVHRIVSFPMIDTRDFSRLWMRFGTDLRLRQTDDEGNTPLHVGLLLENRTVDLFRLLVDSNPEVLRIANNKGELPLDLMIRRYNQHHGGGRRFDDDDTDEIQRLIRHVVEVHPPSLEAQQHHVDDELYPFVLSWMNPNSVFQVLVSKPSLMT